MADCLFVHMDDNDNEMQTYTFKALAALAKIQPNLMIRKARIARERHRSPYFCDQLIELVQNNRKSSASESILIDVK